MVDRNVLFKIIDNLEKHLSRVRQKNIISYDEFISDSDISDILLFNIGQAIQNCIDIAAHIVSEENLGIAGSNAEFFYMLREHSFIDGEMEDNLIKTVGFRNVISHEYIRMDWAMAYQVATKHYQDLEQFAYSILVRYGFVYGPDWEDTDGRSS